MEEDRLGHPFDPCTRRPQHRYTLPDFYLPSNSTGNKSCRAGPCRLVPAQGLHVRSGFGPTEPGWVTDCVYDEGQS